MRLTGIGLWILCLNQAFALVCEPYIRQYETAHGIPNKLLTAISLVESGRKMGGSVVSWAWTINANGAPYVFPTKKAAIAKVRELKLLGINSIDVGCMQVNLKQHPKAFATLEEAFDPAANIAYAAKFLKEKKATQGSWSHAVAHYHSATPEFHIPYKAKVMKTWQKMHKGKLDWQPSLDELTSPTLMTYMDLERHKGEFVRKVVTPSGRHVPLKIRFAPYRGLGNTVQRKPKIIKGLPVKGYGKIIINNSQGIGIQKIVKLKGFKTPSKVIFVSSKTKKVILPRRFKNKIIKQ